MKLKETKVGDVVSVKYNNIKARVCEVTKDVVALQFIHGSNPEKLYAFDGNTECTKL